MKKMFLILLILSILALLVYSGYTAWNLWSNYKQDQNAYNSISSEYTTHIAIDENNEPDSTSSPNKQGISPFDPIIVEEICPISVDFDRLLSVNSDCVGWIYSPDNNSLIDYPIMKGKNNYYYLDRGFDKSERRAGAIFMDYQNKRDFSDFNTILYGHCMNDNSMFGTLKKYMEQEYYEQFPHMYLLTPEQNYKLVVIAAFTTESTNKEDYHIFNTAEDFNKHVENILKKSILDTDTDPASVDKIITLSTCSREFGGARWLVICQPVPIK